MTVESFGACSIGIHQTNRDASKIIMPSIKGMIITALISIVAVGLFNKFAPASIKSFLS